MPSSSETASINDASNIDDGRLDDTSSVERAAVFHDLDTYLDAQLMNINFLDLPDGTWPNPISANGAAGDGIVDEDLSATTNSADLAPARRDSISAHSNSSVSVGRPRGISLLAPVLNRQFSSELMVAWVS
ncbi:unnamed protein product, partial [Dibothriocephalus latus]